MPATAGILGALTQVSGGSASDSDILFEFILSQRMVESVDADLDLRHLYNRPEGDPVFTLGEDATIEDLLAYWKRMIDLRYESSTGIIDLRANAFTPEDAQAIAASDCDEIERAGEPAFRTVPRRRHPLRNGGSRGGRGAPDGGPPAACQISAARTASSTRRPTWPGRWGWSTRSLANSPRHWSNATCS